MESNFKIINPKANSVIGMYVDEPIGMDHPLFMVRFQSRIDAGFDFQNGKPIQDAIQSTVKRMRLLFGDDIPEELVRTTVSLVYAENAALQPMQSGDKLPIPSRAINIEGCVEVKRETQLLDKDIHNSRLNRVKMKPLILIPALIKLAVEKVKILMQRGNKLR